MNTFPPVDSSSNGSPERVEHSHGSSSFHSLKSKLRRAQSIIKKLGPHTVFFLLLGTVATIFGFQQIFSSRGLYLGTQAAGTQTVEYVASQVVNEDGDTYTSSNQSGWFGNAGSIPNSYLGIYFQGPVIPANAQIENIELSVFSSQKQWINQSTRIYAQASPTVAQFSQTNRPSSRTLSSEFLQYANNVNWNRNTKYTFPSLMSLSPVISQHQGSFALILKGTGTASWGRKNIYGSSNQSRAPRVLVTYTVPDGSPVPTTPPATPPQSTSTPTPVPTATPTAVPTATPVPTASPTPTPSGGGGTGSIPGESMAMQAWKVGGKNSPNPLYDKCDDNTNIVTVHNMYHVIGYDGMKYPTWHPPVVNNPVTGVGKCYFGHEHGTNPQGYVYWNEIVQHFGKDLNNDGVITPISISSTGAITPGDRAGLPFGIANEHMEMYYNVGAGSWFARHEDHVGHKVEFVNNEAQMVGNTTHPMAQIPNTVGVNVPFGASTYTPTGVVCTHLHKFHQGTHAPDAIRNNLHETIMHSKCVSTNFDSNGHEIVALNPETNQMEPVNAVGKYPNNTVLLTGMMAFGNPGGYKRFCGNNRDVLKCPDGYKPDGSCVITDPLINQLPNSVYSDTLGRNMVDRSCLEDIDGITGQFYFTPYEIWQGDLRIIAANGDIKAEHGRQWDVLDPIRFVDPNSSTGMSYNSLECGPGGLLNTRTLLCEHNGNYINVPWDSPQSGFRGLKRTTYFGRNKVLNQGGPEVWYTDPLGSNGVTQQNQAGSLLKQKFSSVNSDICQLHVCGVLNDRALQRQFNDGNGTVHAPN